MDSIVYGIKVDYSRDKLFDELGLKRLKESYLANGEVSPQERFAYIAHTFGSNGGHAQRLYDYASQHWLSFATPILSFANKKRQLPISCVDGEMWVSVKSCGAKKIKDVKIGDLVLTHKGRWRKVSATRQSVSDDLYELVVTGRTTKLRLTGNHQVLTNLGWKRVDELTPSILVGVNKIYEESDVELPHTITTANTYVSNSYNETSYQSVNVTESIQVTPDLAWALGLWFAEGSTTDGGMVRITMASAELPFIDKWVEIMNTHFGINGVSERVSPRGRNASWANGTICSKKIQIWLDTEFGKGCKDKIIPSWILDLPKEHLLQFFDGFYLGDGYKSTSDRALACANPAMVTQLYHILLKLKEHKVSFSIQEKIFNWLKRDDKRVMVAELRIKPLGVRSQINGGIEFIDGNVYQQIKSIRPIHLTRDVYDLTVEEDESFTVAGIIVHNCFLVNMTDSSEGLVDTLSETNWLSMMGGGVGVGVNIRSADEKSVGVMPHLRIYDSSSLAYRQGKTRRGSYAMYLDISHPDILMFLEMRKPTGDPNMRCPNLHHGINITDDFMEIIERCMLDPEADDRWELKDPHNQEVREVVSAKDLWQRILEMRMQTGEPYLHFIDISNRHLPDFQKALGLSIKQSNLCSEIILATDAERTAVCCLSSLNLEYYDRWKHDRKFLLDIAEFLDNVLQFFIDHAPDTIARAKYSAMRERSIGIGALGFHALLQQKMIPWESPAAIGLNKMIFKGIREELDQVNLVLGQLRGEAPDAQSVINIEDNDGRMMVIQSSNFFNIMRAGISMTVRGFQLVEEDEIINNALGTKIGEEPNALPEDIQSNNKSITT